MRVARRGGGDLRETGGKNESRGNRACRDGEQLPAHDALLLFVIRRSAASQKCHPARSNENL
jgi:hypothetical protein